MKYIIASNISVEPIADHFGQNIDNYNWLLFDKDAGRKYVLTDTMKYLLAQFSQSVDLDTVYDRISVDTAATADVIKQTTAPFINLLLKRKMLIPEDGLLATVFQKDRCIGDTFSKYTVTDILQAGKKGCVYKLTDGLLNNAFVGKCIVSDKVGKKKFELEKIRCKQEYEITKLMSQQSSYFVRPIEIIDTNEYCLITEYFDGITLQKHLSVNALTFNNDNIQSLIYKIFEAFSIIHKNQIFHGDIHFKNILIDGDENIKVIDFGLSNHEVTDKDEIINNGGIHFFCPPERIGPSMHSKFIAESSYRSEVYQVGLIAYQLLVGNLPFRGFTWSNLSESIKTCEFDFIPPEGYPQLSLTNIIKPILECALSKDPQQRYSSCEEMFNVYKITIENYADRSTTKE